MPAWSRVGNIEMFLSKANQPVMRTPPTDQMASLVNLLLRLVGERTICDFYDFGLIFAGEMHCLPQRLKSTLFEKILVFEVIMQPHGNIF